MSTFTVFARLPSPPQFPNYVTILEEATTHAFSMQVADWFLAETCDSRPAAKSAIAVWEAKQQSLREELLAPKKVRAAAQCKRVQP